MLVFGLRKLKRNLWKNMQFPEPFCFGMSLIPKAMGKSSLTIIVYCGSCIVKI